ncbi:hypothetical protein [Kitasatospora sp. NPDC088134]|uniref:hypothetical protein n=1 Tax=Kitasatospora sp. NPDC088134 TaxID=3364071 RepID=UPI0038155908
MTPYSLAFYLDVVTTGTVLGARPGDSPERVAELLGTDFAEYSFDPHHLIRDYGLTEFHWDRARPGLPWSGHHFSLQVHRLARVDRSTADSALRARYGRFAPRLRFDKLRRLLERRGVPLVEVPELPANAPYFRTFRQPDSQVSVTFVATHGRHRTPSDLRIGDVYKLGRPAF